jgi:23S rRNA (uracil1939-C5)-methyltransferase
MAAGGDGLAREATGRVVFAEGALPGERVVVELTDERRDFARGHVVEVLDPSPHRVDAPCPSVALGCGGCQWQHADPAAQAGFKRDVVADALRRIAHLDDPPLHPEVVRVAGTRTTLRLGVVDGRAGFRRRHGHELVPVSECLVAHPALHELLREGRYDGVEEVVLRVGASTGERLVVADPRRHAVRVPAGVRVVGMKEVQSGAPAAIHEDVAGRRWRVSALSFFQPGPEAANALVKAVHQAAGDAGRGVVVDAYAGVGLLGGSLGPARLVAVESSRWAAADAVVNLADLDARVITGEVARVTPAEPADLVVADPARSGLGRSAATALAAAGAPRLVLVSCDPASLARDVNVLADLGYRLASAQVLDLFPHTFHIEVVSRFDRA